MNQICEEIQYEVETIDRIQVNKKSNTSNHFKIKIGTITASYYNALAMFLFASDLKPDKLAEKVKKIKSLIELDERILDQDH